MIEIKDLTFGYSKKKALFKKMSLSLKPGHIYGLLGKNGAGKSTLIKNITGLVFPQRGSCKINGKDSSKRSPEVLGGFFLIPEEIYLPPVRVEKFAEATGVFYTRFDFDQFHQYLKEFEIETSDNISSLSFGQQKKVMISFALAANTDLLIMDEPTNGLDIPSKTQFRKIVSGALTPDKCILISTHQVRDLENLIDALIVISDQDIVLNSTVDDIANRLLFGSVTSLDDQKVLYYEKSIKGYSVITANTTGSSSRVDLELLFSALVDDSSKIIYELNLGAHE